MNLVRPALSRSAKRLLRFGSEVVVTPPRSSGVCLLYIHIPFCPHLCTYCSFHRVRYDERLAERYFQVLRKEICAYADMGYQFDSVYVGGGTPTMNLPELVKTLELVRSLFVIESISVETNPNHLQASTFDALQSCAINRLSVGVQSFDDDHLARMGRLEAYGTGREIESRLRETEGVFQTLNVDMIFNLPGQGQQGLRDDVSRLVDSGVGQASFYPLMVSDSTRRRINQEMGRFSYRQEEDMYYAIVDQMGQTHEPSSVWCFSRNDQQIDEYIVDYPEFIGVGSGAFSYVRGVFYANSFSILKYDELLSNQKLGITRARTLTQGEQRYYQLLTRLFGGQISHEQVSQIFGDSFPVSLAALKTLGVVDEKEAGYALTRRGLYYWLVAMSEFLNGVNNLRDQMRTHIAEEMRSSYPETMPVTVRQAASND